MRKLATLLLLLLMVCLVAPSAFAQEGGAKPASVNWVAVSTAFGMAIAAAFCGLAQGRVGSAACEGLARNPGAQDSIRGAMLLSLVFIESLVLFTLAMIFLNVK